MRKLQKVVKRINLFVTQTIKNYKSMKQAIKKIMLVLVVSIVTCSCGSTKVAVDRPAQGTSTTITVTTNNPITTEVNPNVELKTKGATK